LKKAIELSLCVPCYKKKKYNRAPIDEATQKLIRRKSRLWSRYMEIRDVTKYKEYCRCRNKVRSITRSIQKSYKKRMTLNTQTEPKNFCRYANSKLKCKSNTPDLYLSSEHLFVTVTDKQKVEVLSNFFASVYTDISDDVLPALEPRSLSYKMEEIKINTELVEKLLYDLKPSKSAGPDNIHSRVLKELASQLASPLALIFRSSLSTGKLPVHGSLLSLLLCIKKGDKKDPSTYRPVSLTSVVCKILENIIRDHIIDHYKKNALIFSVSLDFCQAVLLLYRCYKLCMIGLIMSTKENQLM